MSFIILEKVGVILQEYIKLDLHEKQVLLCLLLKFLMKYNPYFLKACIKSHESEKKIFFLMLAVMNIKLNGSNSYIL